MVNLWGIDDDKYVTMFASELFPAFCGCVNVVSQCMSLCESYTSLLAVVGIFVMLTAGHSAMIQGVLDHQSVL